MRTTFLNLTVQRKQICSNGCFSDLLKEDGSPFLVTLERVYSEDQQSFKPKVPAGVYVCERGIHTLEHHPVPFEAFEVTQVPGHTKILLHVANWQSDLDGCFGLGKERVDDMISNSRDAFNEFMALQVGLKNFLLTVRDHVD